MAIEWNEKGFILTGKDLERFEERRRKMKEKPIKSEPLFDILAGMVDELPPEMQDEAQRLLLTAKEATRRKMPDSSYNKELKRVQGIVPWREEDKTTAKCLNILDPHNEWYLHDQVIHMTKYLPEGVKVYIVGGLVKKRKTKHDIDIFVENSSGRDKDEIDEEIKDAFFSKGLLTGRLSRVYNLEKFEEDSLKLKELMKKLETARSGDKKSICQGLLPIIEIHSHCYPGESEDFESDCKGTPESIGEAVWLECEKGKGCKEGSLFYP